MSCTLYTSQYIYILRSNETSICKYYIEQKKHIRIEENRIALKLL